MPNMLKQDKVIVLILILLFFIILPFFYLKQGLLLIDTGREFYIPQQMLQGNILYKDIYNIYGAMSYQINALLMAIFGQKINTLYIAGCINSLIIIITTYLLSREFLKKSFSFLFTILIMFALVFQTFLYNANLTYCFAITYALSAFLISVLFITKYIKTENPLMAYISCFFAGICLANKYEFILYPLILIYVIFFLKPLGKIKSLKAILYFMIVPFISYGILFLQGLNINDIKDNIILMNNLVNAPLIKLFFYKTGALFNPAYLSGLIKNNGLFTIFGIIPILNLILFLIKSKSIVQDKALFVFILCAITASAKSFLYLNVNHMGIFLFPVCTLAALILISKFNEKYILIILTACILMFAAEDFSSVKYKNFELKTAKGTINVYKKEGEMIDYVSKYIVENEIKAPSTVVIMPEGSIINYITDIKGDNYYYNLSPLFYNDVFKEERIINHFNENLPDYFTILPIDNIEYGSSFFGKDYAQNFYNMIIDNYELIDENNNIQIFKKK